ncbi:MAG: phosphate/phosphite/phosphonate ABC transporter substrate-binding protein [Sandaracinaceae bacterium]
MTETLTFATGPVMLDDDGEELRLKVADRLATELGEPVSAKACTSYAELAELCANEASFVAWLPPAIFVRADERVGLRLLAEVERLNGSGYRGVLFVPADSTINRIEDLEDTRVAWVDRDSCAGHLYPKLELRERRLEPKSLFSAERFEGSHLAVVRAVQEGRVDVGATHAQTNVGKDSVMLAGWAPYVGLDAMRPVLVTRAIPADAIAAPRTLDKGIAARVQRVLLALHETDPDLLDELFGATKLKGGDPAHYEPVRAAMK